VDVVLLLAVEPCYLGCEVCIQYDVCMYVSHLDSDMQPAHSPAGEHQRGRDLPGCSPPFKSKFKKQI